MNFRNLKAIRNGLALLALTALSPLALSSQTVKDLYNFTHQNGAYPAGTLVQGFDGSMYGTADFGGEFFSECVQFHTAGCGTVFKITPAGEFTLLHSFRGTDGAQPIAGLTVGPDGSFYGATTAGGPEFATNTGYGTIFKISPTGDFTTLYNFAGFADGATPQGTLLFASDGNLYGAAIYDGQTSGSCGGCGTIFKISPVSGEFTVLHNFYGNPDGGNPQGGLIEGLNGNFYGTASFFGSPSVESSGPGTVFEITPSGQFTVLHSFNGADGSDPIANLTLGSDGNFYGTTASGGAIGSGTVFKMTPDGTLTTLHNFTPEEEIPFGAMVQAQDGNFYGTVEANQTTFSGSLFKITPDGAFTSLVTFPGDPYWGGDEILAGLRQRTGGTFYGVAQVGGPVNAADCNHEGCGAVFTLSVGLGPFVETVPLAATAGTTVQVLGSDLTGASSVTFNGKTAKFTVVSPTQISTNVPSGAVSGPVIVTTPQGTLQTIPVFRVIP